jgi:hypothetical protein
MDDGTMDNFGFSCETNATDNIHSTTTYNNIVMQYGGFDIKVNSMMMRDGKLVGMDEICITDEMIDEIDGLRNKSANSSIRRYPNGTISAIFSYYGGASETLDKIAEMCNGSRLTDGFYPIPLMLFILNITKHEDIELLPQNYLDTVYAFSLVVCTDKYMFPKYNKKVVEFMDEYYGVKKYTQNSYARNNLEHVVEHIFNPTFSYNDLLKTKLGKHIDKFITQSRARHSFPFP